MNVQVPYIYSPPGRRLSQPTGTARPSSCFVWTPRRLADNSCNCNDLVRRGLTVKLTNEIPTVVSRVFFFRQLLLPCKSPKADPGLAIPSPAANFLKLVSLVLGRGLDADEKARSPPPPPPPPRPVNPSKLDCLVLAKFLKISNQLHCLFLLPILSHLFCTLIFENQGLDKSRSVSNLIKISVSVHLIFFSVHLIFFQFVT